MSAESKGLHGAVSLLIDLDSQSATEMAEMTLASAGLRERNHLQRWVTEYPELIGPGLLLVTTEFDHWEVRDRPVADRLDALFLDTSGAPVVAEFKRDRATDTVELQALKYAAYCSQLTLEDMGELLATSQEITKEEAQQRLLDHSPTIEETGLQQVKVLLVAGGFGPAVTSVVLWLRDYGVDIGCVEVSAHAVPGGHQAILVARQLLPLPEAEDYLVRRKRKEQEEDAVRRQPTEGSWDSYEERFPDEHVHIARRLFELTTQYVEEHGLPWTPALRGWWLGYKRAGGYYVPIINLRVEKPIEFMVKLPQSPELLGLDDPYPDLPSRWEAGTRQWGWQVPSIQDVPDVSVAIDLSRKYQPTSGPMKVH